MGQIDPGTIAFTGNLFVRCLSFRDAGDYMPGHEHEYDHVTFVNAGRVRFHRDDAPEADRDVAAPGFIETPARQRHTIVALEAESVAYCVFAVRDEAGAVLDAAAITDDVRARKPVYAE